MPANYEEWKERRERRYPNGERMPDEVTEEDAPADESSAPNWGDVGRTGMFTRRKCAGKPDGSWAVVLIIIGVLFFLSNIGLLRINTIWQFWPVFVILAGLSKLANTRGAFGYGWAFVVTAAGCLMLLVSLGLLHFHARQLLPIAFVGAGVLILARNLGRASAPQRQEMDDPRDFPDGDGRLAEWTLFGGVKRAIHSQNFVGGELNSVFGGIEIDLRGAEIAVRDKPVVIEANAAFGGISIKVPDGWRVAVHGVGIFGGYEDKTIRRRGRDEFAPLLVISGYAVFGGVVVE